jgi:Protein of unknown function (DUF559)
VPWEGTPVSFFANRFNAHWASNYYKHVHGKVQRQTDIEPHIAKLGLVYRAQHPFPGVYGVADFLIEPLGLIIEIDGPEHLKGEKLEKDQARDAALARNGYVTVRLTNAEVEADPAAALQRALKVYEEQKC